MRVSAVELRNTARELTQLVREVRAILNNGIRLADQLAGGVRSFRWSSTASPVLVSAPSNRPPAGLLVLSVAESRGDLAAKVSCASITWTHSDRGILVSDIGGTTPGTDYDVTVAIVEG